MILPKNTWIHFKSAFCSALDEADKAKLLEAWETGPNKTTFYARTFMPAVAAKLGYGMETETFRCDYTFRNADGVPVIFAEAENAHPTAHHEVKSLCSLAAPLKVLIISCEWQDSERDKYLPMWCEIMRTHHAVISLDCHYAIVVGEWHGTDERLIEYSFTLVDTAGKVIEESFHPIAP